MSDNAIELRQVSHVYGSRAVLRNVSFAIPRGSVFAFLGRNGMGKTTTMRLALGLLKPTRGEVMVFGQPAARLSPAQRARIGYMAEGHPIHDGDKVGECAALRAALSPHWDARLFAAVAEHFRLASKTRVKQLSRGERAGLSLALTLAQSPELLLMDDPTLGLDPLARHGLLEAIVYVAREHARTIFLTSHWLADVERVADALAIIDDGRLRACCGVDDFREGVSQCIATFEEGASQQLFSNADGLGLLRAQRLDEHRWRVIAVSDMRALAQKMKALGAGSVREESLDLERAFIEFVQPDGGSPSFFDSARKAG